MTPATRARLQALVKEWQTEGARLDSVHATFRLNEGNVKVHTLDRLDAFVDGMADKRLTYKGLIQ